jgi:hypothetical protein
LVLSLSRKREREKKLARFLASSLSLSLSPSHGERGLSGKESSDCEISRGEGPSDDAGVGE